MENRSRMYWIVGAIAAGGVVLSLILGAVAGGAAGYFFGKRAARAETPAVDSSVVGRLWQQPQAEPEATPRSRVQIPSVQVAAELITVVPGGPAEEAGLQAGDLVIAVDKAEVTMTTDLSQLIRQYDPGDTVSIRYLRDDTEYTARVTLGAKDSDPSAPYLGVEYQTNLQVGSETTPR